MQYLAQANTSFAQFGELVMFDSRDGVDIDTLDTPDKIAAVVPKSRGVAGQTFVNGIVGQVGDKYWMTNFLFNTRRTKFTDMISNPLVGSYNIATASVIGTAHQESNMLATIMPFAVMGKGNTTFNLPQFGAKGAYGGGYSYTYVARMSSGTSSDIMVYGPNAPYEAYQYINPTMNATVSAPEVLIMRGTGSYGHERPGYGGSPALISSNCLSWANGNFADDDESPILDRGVMYSPAQRMIIRLKDEIAVNGSLTFATTPGSKPVFNVRSRKLLML